MNERVKAATEQVRVLSEEELRERIIRLAFGGDRERFELFLTALREALPDDVTVVLRGSAVIGVRWEDGAPFDPDGPGTRGRRHAQAVERRRILYPEAAHGATER
jgi:hypothetical protein